MPEYSVASPEIAKSQVSTAWNWNVVGTSGEPILCLGAPTRGWSFSVGGRNSWQHRPDTEIGLSKTACVSQTTELPEKRNAANP